MGAISRMCRRGASFAAANSGPIVLPEPPSISGFVAAWHYLQGLNVNSGHVESWESYSHPSTPVVFEPGGTEPTVVDGAPSFGGSTSPMQVTIGAYTGCTLAVAYKRSTASTALAYMAAMRDTDVANGTLRVQFGSGAVATTVPNIWREDPFLGGGFSPGPSGSSAPGKAIVASGENPRAYAWRPETGDIQQNGAAGAYGFAAGSSSFIRLSDATQPFHGEIYAVAAWKHPATQAQCVTIMEWLESLPRP